jgi:hypothetical protein
MDLAYRNIAQAAGFIAPPGYSRHRPETTPLYRLVAEHYPTFRDRRAAEGRPLPRYVEDEFKAYLKCGRLEHGFLRVKCESCQAEKLVSFSCKRRGFCPSCGARPMAETAALLVDDILPRQPVRQCVLSLPFALRYLFATRPEVVRPQACLCDRHRAVSSLWQEAQGHCQHRGSTRHRTDFRAPRLQLGVGRSGKSEPGAAPSGSSVPTASPSSSIPALVCGTGESWLAP